jgi:hypothetical protein
MLPKMMSRHVIVRLTHRTLQRLRVSRALCAATDQIGHSHRRRITSVEGLSGSRFSTTVIALIVLAGIEHDDPDLGWDALTAVHKQIDTPQQRARLADAIVRLRDQHQINRRQAAYALIDLHSQSTGSSPPACYKPSPSQSAPNAPQAASTPPPNPTRLSGGGD